MKKGITGLALAALTFFGLGAFGVTNYYTGLSNNLTTKLATQRITGRLGLASSASASGYQTYWFDADSRYGLKLSTQFTMLNSSMTLLGANGNILSKASMTASSFWGDGAHLSGVSVDLSTITTALNLKLTSGAVPSNFVDLSTVTALYGPYLPWLSTTTFGLVAPGSAFSVGGSPLVVANGKVGIGTAAPGSTLDVNGTVRGQSNLIVVGTGTFGGSITMLNANARCLGANNAVGQGFCLDSAVQGDKPYIVNYGPIELRGFDGGAYVPMVTMTSAGGPGKLGIMTTPQTTLDVNGTITGRSNIVAVGSGTIGGAFQVSGSTLMVTTTGDVTIGKLSGAGSRCVHADANGVLGVIAGDCGTGGGDVTTGGDNDFTGANTHAGNEVFSASSTFHNAVVGAPLVYSQALDYSRTVKGAWSVVNYSSFTSAAMLTFTDLRSSYTYRGTWQAIQNTNAATIQLSFTGNTGTNHSTYASGYLESTGAQGAGALAGASCYLTHPANTIGVGYEAAGQFFIRAGRGATGDTNGRVTREWVTGDSIHYSSTNQSQTAQIGCAYFSNTAVPAPHPTSFTLGASAGTITGYLTIEALWTPLVP